MGLAGRLPSRGLLLRGYALLDLSESAFTAADCGEEPRQLPDFTAVEKALRGNLAPIGRLRLLSARIEPDSEASFLFSTTAEPLPAGDGRTNRPRPAVAPVR